MIDQKKRDAAVAATAELAEVIKLNDGVTPRTDGHMITESGQYEIPHDAYHADPTPNGSLSVSGARLLLPPNCPALFRWLRDHPNARATSYMDFGIAAHAKLLGIGPELIEVKAPDWRSSAAQRAKDEAHACGGVPVLTKDLEVINDMMKALQSHSKVKKIFSSGKAEQSFFWTDPQTKIMRRMRADFVPDPLPSGDVILVDYKTAKSAHPREFARTAPLYGYEMAADWYMDGVRSVTGRDTGFLFVVQEKIPPYLVSVVELDVNALRRGRNRNRRAIDLYAECVRTGMWPGYTDDQISLQAIPVWAEREDDHE